MEFTTHAAQLIAGIEHHRAGRLGEATHLYSRILAAQPEYGHAWRMLGVVALQSSDGAAARSLLERAIRIDPADAEAHSALGAVGELQNDLERAYAAYTTALALADTLEAATVGLARVALALGRAATASAVAQAGIERGMRDPELLRTLGSARLKLRDYASAAEVLRGAVHLQPQADAYANLAVAYLRLHELAAAREACDRALMLEPRHAAATNTLGCIQAATFDLPAAFAAFEHAIALGSGEAHWNLGTGLLLAGDYRAGWRHFGWESPERRANPAYTALPMWDGTPAPSARLLVWPEQGVGDTIQMARFVARARGRVGSITLACQPGTRALLQTLAGVDHLIDTLAQLQFEHFDMWLPTIRLPGVLDVARDDVAAQPYLQADPGRVERFRRWFNTPGRLRVGLVWAGNPNQERDELRSCALSALEPLGDIPAIAWYALQQGAGRAQQAQSPLELIPINEEVADFADTAAIVSQLDLVISVDTSVAHLCGALGRPAWILIPERRPDWRWQLAGETSVWYDSLRLFRQGADGTWPPVIAALGLALREVAAANSARGQSDA